MDFMAFILFVLFIGFLGINIWDEWELREHGSPFEPKFLPRRFLRHLIVSREVHAELPDAKFAIQQKRSALRCEVCHQVDRFDAESGMCERCNHCTL
ncbi:MAG: hypothetical protein JNN15_06480 [Blastocatellia bacterium]|nr:hypothetical protein [Blastocatellia bacterium]